MIVYDDMEPSEKIKLYDKGVDISRTHSGEDQYEHLISYRSGDMHAPKLDEREALSVEVDNIVGAIGGSEDLRVDGEAGWRVVRILEAAQRSIAVRGEPVPMDESLIVRGTDR